MTDPDHSTAKLSRRASLLLPLLIPAATAGCSWFDWIGDEEKKGIPGHREAVLAPTRGLQVDDIEPVTVPATITNADWLQYGGGPSHIGGNLGGGLSKSWSASIGKGGAYRARLTAQPLVTAGQVLTMDTDGAVTATDLAKGARLWRTETRPKKVSTSNIGGGIAVGGSSVFAVTGRAEALMLDLADGRIVWRVSLGSPARSAPSIVGGSLYVCTLDQRLVCLSCADGKQLWEYQATDANTGTLGQAAPAFADGVVVAGFESGDLSALRADTGTLVWTDNMGAVKGTAGLAEFSSVRGAPVIDGGLVFAIGLGGLFAALDLRSGRRVWQRDVAGGNTPWLAGDFVYVVSSEQKLAALSKSDGGVHWVTDLPRFKHPKRTKGLITWSGPGLFGGKLVLVGDHGKMAVVDPTDGTLVSQTDLEDTASVAPIAAQNTVLVLTDDATLTAFR